MTVEAIEKLSERKSYLEDQIRSLEESSFAPSSYQISKPELSAHYNEKEATPAPIVCARLMDALKDYILSTSEPAELKQDHLGEKIVKTKKSLHKTQKEIVQSKKAIDTWQWRKNLAGYLFNGVSLLAGVGLCASGQVGAGGSLIASSAGSTLSQVLASMGCKESITGALSVASSLVGVFGTLGCGAYRLFTKPTATLTAMQGSTFSSFLQGAEVITSFAANGFGHVANIKKNDNLEKCSQLEALHTRSDTLLKTLDQKHSGAATGFQSSAKNFSEGFRTISKAYSRYTRDAMRVLTADFPG